MGFKPIFEEERQFFREKTGIDLPTECWRNGSKIYLDFTSPKPLIEFKVENGKINITKDRRNGYIEKKKHVYLPEQKKLDELVELNHDRINSIYQKSILLTIEIIKKYPNHFYLISYSGGKDSVVTYSVWEEALSQIDNPPEWIINFANTSNDTADTYREIKSLPQDKLKILNPELGFYQWLVNKKNYYLPSVRVRNCCSTYKEGQVNRAFSADVDTINVSGVRKHESVKRSGYQTLMDYEWRNKHFSINSFPKKWITFAPLCDDWADEDIWLFLLMNKMHFNPMYRKGFNRVGCLICPFQQAYTDLLTQYWYPKSWERWLKYLRKSYEIRDIRHTDKWAFEEWANGQWKTLTSKEHMIISQKPTPERIKELAELKGISEAMAIKYFNRTCPCGKKLNPTEISMFFKTQGRLENQEDNRDILCKSCLCDKMGWTKTQYKEKRIEFQESGCNLF